MPVSRRVLIAALAVAALAAPLPAAATAVPAQNRTTVTMEVTATNSFAGELVSPTTSCEKGRKVTIYRELFGKPGKPLGSVRSGADGSWKVKVNVPGPGTYYAKVAAKPGIESLTACRAGKSEEVIFD